VLCIICVNVTFQMIYRQTITMWKEMTKLMVEMDTALRLSMKANPPTIRFVIIGSICIISLFSIYYSCSVIHWNACQCFILVYKSNCSLSIYHWCLCYICSILTLISTDVYITANRWRVGFWCRWWPHGTWERVEEARWGRSRSRL